MQCARAILCHLWPVWLRHIFPLSHKQHIFQKNDIIEHKMCVPKRNMKLGRTRLKGRPRNRWQDEVREDGRIVDGDGWQEKLHNRQEWKKLLRMARNHHILHMPME